VAALPQRPGAVLSSLPEHERGMTLRAGSASIANAPKLGIELVLSHRTFLEPRVLARRDIANTVEFKTVVNSVRISKADFCR
jgi:hypothetical protein